MKSAAAIVIDTAAELMDADPAWLYEAAQQKWAVKDIVAAQNALRQQQGREPVAIPGSTWLSIAGQDFSRLNLDETPASTTCAARASPTTPPSSPAATTATRQSRNWHA